MLNVYLLNVSFDVAGAERRFVNIWNGLRRRGNVRPILVLPQCLAQKLKASGELPGGGDSDVWEVPEFSISSCFGPPFGMIRTRLLALRFKPFYRLIQNDPNCVVHFGLPSGPVVTPDLPTVYECVDSTLKGFKSSHYRRATRRCCIIHCQTNRIAEALKCAWQKEQPLWKLAVNPCCFAQYSTELQPLARDSHLILFAGRLSNEKSPLLFLQALHLLKERGAAFRAIILGKGPLYNSVKIFIRDHNLGNIVEVKHSYDIKDQMQSASIFVSLQTGDNYPSQSLLEAMGAGCAVVATDVGETWRIVDDQVGCRVPLNAAAVANAIERLLNNPAMTIGLGTQARNRVLQDFTLDRYLDYVENLYHDAITIHNSRL